MSFSLKLRPPPREEDEVPVPLIYFPHTVVFKDDLGVDFVFEIHPDGGFNKQRFYERVKKGRHTVLLRVHDWMLQQIIIGQLVERLDREKAFAALSRWGRLRHWIKAKFKEITGR